VLPQSSALIALMMEAARTSETSVDIYLTTWQYISEDSELYTRCRVNLKSQTENWYSHILKLVTENEDIAVLWNQEVQMDK
jgi:hypothetical protein